MRLGGKGRYISLFCCHANANRRRKDVGQNVSVRCETLFVTYRRNGNGNLSFAK